MAAEEAIMESSKDAYLKEYNMHSPDSKQRLQNKIQQAPGSWFSRKSRTIGYYIYGIVVSIVSFKIFRELKLFSGNRRYDPGCEPRRPGEVVVITGGPRGIAYQLAKKFLQLDFIVIMGARDVTTSQAKVDQLRQQGVVNGTIHLFPLNLKSLASTKNFAENVLALTSRIDILLNNAGISMTPYECTEDGYESQFQVNYLSHFLLTNLLLPTIKRTAAERGDGASCRIVSTTSFVQHVASLDFDDLETREVYVPGKCYSEAKLCQVLFTKQLEKRLQNEKSNVHVFAVHPGSIPTDIWEEAGISSLLSCIARPLVSSVEDGADAVVYAALSSKLETKGGSYLEGLRLTAPNTQANNVYYQELLWSRSEFFTQAFV